MDTRNMFEPEASQFIKSLTPVSVLALMGDMEDKLHYEEAVEYISSHDLNIDNFYFNRGNYFSWFCYYHDYVLIDIPHLTKKQLELGRIADYVNLETEKFQAAVKLKEFKSFFYMIDKRISLCAYQQLYDNIPDNEKYELLWLVFSRCAYRLEDFHRDTIEEILQYKPAKIEIPNTDNNGYVDIYRGQIPGSTPVNQATSWTTDINTALFYATLFDFKGDVFQARIHQDNIIAYIKWRNEKEIIAYPENIIDINKVELPGFDDLQPILQEAGVLQDFTNYLQHLKADYFHNPFGIHGLPHTRRVLLLVLILAFMKKLDARGTCLLATAALYHDIGRQNDNYDPCHGQQSYDKVLKLGLLQNITDKNDLEIIRFLIINHCIEDNMAVKKMPQYKVGNREYALRLYYIFKDADGLERIRINDLDIKHLRTASAQKLPLVARQLLNATTWS